MSFKSAIFTRVNSEFMQRDHHGGGVSMMLRTPLSLIKLRLLRRQWLLIAFFARAAVHGLQRKATNRVCQQQRI